MSHFDFFQINFPNYVKAIQNINTELIFRFFLLLSIYFCSYSSRSLRTELNPLQLLWENSLIQEMKPSVGVFLCSTSFCLHVFFVVKFYYPGQESWISQDDWDEDVWEELDWEEDGLGHLRNEYPGLGTIQHCEQVRFGNCNNTWHSYPPPQTRVCHFHPPCPARLRHLLWQVIERCFLFLTLLMLFSPSYSCSC